MAVYMGGSHRTTDMSPAANKREGERGNERSWMMEGESKRRREEIARGSIFAKI